jgi:SAM-dependent methyltransferase
MRELQALTTYQALAPIYNAFHYRNDYEMWLGRLLLPELEGHGVAVGSVLDVGCGTGRAFAPLLRRGWKVHGCDISPAMLELAREEAAGSVTLELADMTELPKLGSFDLVIALNDINYGLEQDDLVRTLAGMRANLGPGGLILFDSNSAFTYRARYGAAAETVIAEPGGRRWTWRGRGEAGSDSGDGQIYEARIEGDGIASVPHVERYRPRPEVEEAMRQAGLDLLATLGMKEHGDEIQLSGTVDEASDEKVVYIGALTGEGSATRDPR